MPLILQSLLVVTSILFLIFICYLVAQGRLQIKYSLLWMLLAVLILMFAAFPQVIYSLSDLLGFETPSNLALFAGLFFLLVVSVSLSVIVSWQAHYIRDLIQDISLLRKEVDELGKSRTIPRN